MKYVVYIAVSMHACDQLSPSHCNPMDCSLPGSSVHGFFPGKNIGMEMPFSPPGDLPDASVELTCKPVWNIVIEEVTLSVFSST